MRVVKIPVFHMTAYAPGKRARIHGRSGLRWINTYRDTAPPMPEELTPRDLRNIERVKAHAVHLFGEDQERDIEILHSTLAYIVQTNERVNWITVIQGAEKIGKTFYAQLMCGGARWVTHVYELDSGTLCESPFTDWAEGHLLLISRS